MTLEQFMTRFPQSVSGSFFAEDISEDYHVHYYRDGDTIGEIRTDRRTSDSDYSILAPNAARACIAYYESKRASEAADAPLLAQIRELAGKLSWNGRVELESIAANLTSVGYRNMR